MREKHAIFLIPGFFGFADLGELLYYAHVSDYLPAACAQAGFETEVHAVHTFPTASIRRRAERLVEQIAEVATDVDAIHLIGHSSGGLDARLLVAPGVSLRSAVDVESIASRVRTVVMISTPNYGTPVATFFTSLLGQQLLHMLSLGTIYVLRFGRLPTSVIFRMGALLARMDNWVGLRNNVLDQLFDQLLADFSPERRRAVEAFFSEMGSDQALLPQLTPEGIDIFNAATADRPGVRYGSVISYARRPGLFSTVNVGLDPYGQATHAMFITLYRLASRMPAERMPELTDRQMEVLFTLFGIVPAPEANDGLVPTLSQIWGEIIHATRADHLDVLGHFGDAKHQPPHIDWLSSGSSFDRLQFEALWTDVARFVAGRHERTNRATASRGQHLMYLFSR